MLISGVNRGLIEAIIQGDILFEEDNYLTVLREKIVEYPLSERKIKMNVEFSKLIYRFNNGKKLFYEEHYLDAFNYILQALHHLARLSVIKNGLYPELTVWKQVKLIEPEVYKLYDELINGDEPLEKKLELLLLANSFALTSKTKLGCSHLIELMREKKQPWSIEELMRHEEVKPYAIHLTVLLDYLVQKGIVDLVKYHNERTGLVQRTYFVK